MDETAREFNPEGAFVNCCLRFDLAWPARFVFVDCLREIVARELSDHDCDSNKLQNVAELEDSTNAVITASRRLREGWHSARCSRRLLFCSFFFLQLVEQLDFELFQTSNAFLGIGMG